MARPMIRAKKYLKTMGVAEQSQENNTAKMTTVDSNNYQIKRKQIQANIKKCCISPYLIALEDNYCLLWYILFNKQLESNFIRQSYLCFQGFQSSMVLSSCLVD